MRRLADGPRKFEREFMGKIGASGEQGTETIAVETLEGQETNVEGTTDMEEGKQNER